jgi:predicted nucleic acid-binding protein
MTLILDAGGISALAGQRGRLMELRRRGLWPPQVPAAALAESLTGDHRRDYPANRLLRTCQVRDITEPHAREAARLRTATGRAGTITATDAIVAAFASTCPDPVILTTDPRDLTALAQHAPRLITIART